jgi:hypothetical protein
MSEEQGAVDLLRAAFGQQVAVVEGPAGFRAPATPYPDPVEERTAPPPVWSGPARTGDEWAAIGLQQAAAARHAAAVAGFLAPAEPPDDPDVGGAIMCGPRPPTVGDLAVVADVRAQLARFRAPAEPAPCVDPACQGECGVPRDRHAFVIAATSSGPAAAAVIAQETTAGRMDPGTLAPVRPGAGDWTPSAVLVREPTPARFKAPAVTKPGSVDDPLWQQMTAVVRAHAAANPRTLQTRIGPSEIGHPCDARVLRAALEVPKTNLDADPWASVVGTAVHAWLAEAFTAANADLPEGEQWLVERRVYATDGIYGSCDLYRNGDVVDHKIMGTDSMRAIRADGWDAKDGIYAAQLDIYGLGWARAGVDVRDVVLAAWPRSGFLSGLQILRRPWSQQRAERALDRLGELVALAVDPARPDSDGDAFWAGVATFPSKACSFCPWMSETQDPAAPARDRCGAHRFKRAAS